MRMASRYGHTWVSQFGNKPDGIAAAEWRTTLAGITPLQVAEGIKADVSRGTEWPPSSTMFRAMCLGVPTLPAAKLAINDPQNRFALLMWQRMDRHGFRLADAERAENILKGAYDLAREHVMRGGALPMPAVAQVEEKPKEFVPARQETVKKHCDQLRTILGDLDAA